MVVHKQCIASGILKCAIKKSSKPHEIYALGRIHLIGSQDKVKPLTRIDDKGVNSLWFNWANIWTDDQHGMVVNGYLNGAHSKSSWDDSESVTLFGLNLEHRQWHFMTLSFVPSSTTIDQNNICLVCPWCPVVLDKHLPGWHVEPLLHMDHMVGWVKIILCWMGFLFRCLAHYVCTKKPIFTLVLNMRMVEHGSCYLGSEGISEGGHWLDWTLRHIGCPIHVLIPFKVLSMEMYCGYFRGQIVDDIHHHLVSLADSYRCPWHPPVDCYNPPAYPIPCDTFRLPAMGRIVRAIKACLEELHQLWKYH